MKKTGYELISSILENYIKNNDKYYHTDYIVSLRQKYKSEKEWHYLKEYVTYNNDWEWEYDWWEGEECVELLGFDMLSDVTVTSILEIEQAFKKEPCSNVVLSHSEISGQIYAYINNEKYNITKEAIEAVQAIKILEQTKLKPSYNSVKTELDCISRQEVLDEINRIGVKAFETYDDYSELFDFVDSLPSVSTKKIGRWEKIKAEIPRFCDVFKDSEGEDCLAICCDDVLTLIDKALGEETEDENN